MKEKLIIVRNFLYRLFLIGFIFSVISQLAFLYANSQGLQQASTILHVSQDDLIELALKSITAVKTFLFYGVLFPALALHWTVARDKI